MTERESAFVQYYGTTRNGALAARLAGYSELSAGHIAHKLLKKINVAPHIRARLAQSIIDVRLNAQDVRSIWENALIADRNQLAEVRRVACRYCHGVDHFYQETPQEHRTRWLAHRELLKTTPEHRWQDLPPFDEKGGVGYTTKRAPHPDCPECFGDGEERVIIKDTTKLPPEARMLYEGVDVKNGQVVVKMVSRDGAASLLAKHLGMLIDKGAGDDPRQGAIEGQAREVFPDDDEAAARAYQRFIKGG